MVEELYSPPEADVEVVADEPPFYVVSIAKFLTLAIMSLGLYLGYWGFRNWRQIKVREKNDIWPIPRGLFLIFFVHSLMRKVDEKFKEDDVDYDWSPATVATVIVVFILVSAVLDRLTTMSEAYGVIDYLSLAILFPMAMSFIPAQRAINTAAGDPGATGNRKLSVVNMLWIALFTVFWVLMLLGIYLSIVDPTF